MSSLLAGAARRRRNLVVVGILALLLLAVVLVLNRAHDSAQPAEASGTPSVDLSMAVVGAGCDTKIVDVADKCDVPGTFTVVVSLNSIDGLTDHDGDTKAGYLAVQARLDSSERLIPTGARGAPGCPGIGGVSGTFGFCVSPFGGNELVYTGPIFEVDFFCTDVSAQQITMLNLFILDEADNTVKGPSPETLIINCTETGPPSASPVGAMAVDCDAVAAGIQGNCTYPSGSDFSIQVHILAAPPGGYTGYQAKVRWSDAQLDYLPMVGEALLGCGVAQRVDNQPGDPSLIFFCLTGIFDTDTSTGPVLQFEFQCQQDGNTTLELVPREGDPQAGSLFTDIDFVDIEPVLVNATVTCGVPTPTPTPTITRTPTPTETPIPPTPIGGIGIFPVAPGDGADAGGAAVLTWLAAAATAGALALGGAAWYARRHWSAS